MCSLTTAAASDDRAHVGHTRKEDQLFKKEEEMNKLVNHLPIRSLRSLLAKNNLPIFGRQEN